MIQRKFSDRKRKQPKKAGDGSEKKKAAKKKKEKKDKDKDGKPKDKKPKDDGESS